MGIEALVNIDISETINTKEEGGISAAQEFLMLRFKLIIF